MGENFIEDKVIENFQKNLDFYICSVKQQRIKYLRAISGYIGSTDMLAKLCGVSRSTVARWLVGSSRPAIDKRKILSNCINNKIKPEEL